MGIGDATSKDDFVKGVVDMYTATWQRYGQGKLLSFEELHAFLVTPLQVGGGSAPLDKTGRQISLTIYEYSAQQAAMDCSSSPASAPTNANVGPITRDDAGHGAVTVE